MINKESLHTNRFWLLTGLILAIAVMRIAFLPIANFSPIGAMALFGGVYFRDKLFAIVVPLTALLVTDILIEFVAGVGFYSYMIYVYGAFFLTGCIGLLIRDNVKFTSVTMGALGSTVLFFLITNFGAWLGNPFYPKDFSGLLASYTMGLAFYKNELFGNLFLNTLMSELFFTGILFGTFALIRSRLPQLVRA